MILAVDLGTTNWKAALISRQGRLMRQTHLPTPLIEEAGAPCYEAAAVERHLAALLNLFPQEDLRRVDRIALTGMAEAGLLVDRDTLVPLSNIWPWFDRRALPLYEKTRADRRFSGRQEVTGLPDSYKYGIYKLLTLLDTGKYDAKGVKWMGLVAFAASRLTGRCVEDVSLAARTGCLTLRTAKWDEDFLSSVGLSSAAFPTLIGQGDTAGCLLKDFCGLRAGIPVCISGHDHFCAAYAVGAFQRNGLFVSAGTAQVVMGTSHHPETASGLSYGPSPAGAPYTVLGSIQSVGGSINYWKQLLYRGEGFEALLSEAADAPSPSGLVYYPYLAGSGAPHLDPSASGTLIGLRDSTQRGTIIASVYEGLAMETRFLTEAMGTAVASTLYCMGGMTRHPRYMQTLADVLGKTVCVPEIEEGTLYGAAMMAADHTGEEPLPVLTSAHDYLPDTVAHHRWTAQYRQVYLPKMSVTKMEVESNHGTAAGRPSAD